ncbi:HlyD family secretion protein [Orbus hercynius]|uniref:HlyD family secretion protein n=1 Tax=Orbus hercynius TaxID=593135 RepID=A0A495RJQ6_9GAMM|nr:efflux RND transporter periplasmic adaptor subunit [Orbus hercynius]RKS87675.1 HlyD family secretion protein [Orbus hercynius]
MSSKKHIFILFIAIIVLASFILYYSLSSHTMSLQGEVEVNRVDIAARVQGRASQINYDVGDNVSKGDVLLVLSSPSLVAQRDYVQSQLDVAIANRNIAYSTRQETIDAQKAALEKAEADLLLAQLSYERLKKLAEKNLISKQQFDESSNQLSVAKQAREEAKANYQYSVNGNSVESKELADAQVKEAQTALSQVNVDLSELTVISPINGQITAKVAEIGQLYSPGTPLFSIIDLDDMWITFNVREDLLHNAKVGDIYRITIPALKKQIQVRITAINALGEYANWRATKATGDFDLKTFEVRAKPTEQVDGLRPGMSATITWKE